MADANSPDLRSRKPTRPSSETDRTAATSIKVRNDRCSSRPRAVEKSTGAVARDQRAAQQCHEEAWRNVFWEELLKLKTIRGANLSRKLGAIEKAALTAGALMEEEIKGGPSRKAPRNDYTACRKSSPERRETRGRINKAKGKPVSLRGTVAGQAESRQPKGMRTPLRPNRDIGEEKRECRESRASQMEQDHREAATGSKKPGTQSAKTSVAQGPRYTEANHEGVTKQRKARHRAKKIWYLLAELRSQGAPHFRYRPKVYDKKYPEIQAVRCQGQSKTVVTHQGGHKHSGTAWAQEEQSAGRKANET